jgi:hypothetical protein
MPSLPFVQPPVTPQHRRLGTPASGILEMPVLGGLTVGESATIAELLANEQSSFVRGAQIADAIAKAEEISISEAFNIIESAISGRDLEPLAEEIRTRHALEIQDVAQVYAAAGQRNMTATVTALIRWRCKLPEWTTQDTCELHRALFDAIWQLAQEETDSEALPAEPPTEEELGKLPEEDGTRVKRTGRRSSTT